MKDLILMGILWGAMELIFLKKSKQNLRKKLINLWFSILLFLNVMSIKTQDLATPPQKVKLIITMMKKKEFLLSILIDLLLILLLVILIKKMIWFFIGVSVAKRLVPGAPQI